MVFESIIRVCCKWDEGNKVLLVALCIFKIYYHPQPSIKKGTMKLRLLATIMVLFICFKVNAQYVSIPDSNFGKWLHNNGYSACMTGNYPSYQLDTTCNAV